VENNEARVNCEVCTAQKRQLGYLSGSLVQGNPRVIPHLRKRQEKEV